MEKEIRAKLLSMEDLEYKSFHSKLMPTIDPDTIIGIRVPVLRKYTKDLYKNNSVEDFLRDLPHKYYEENNLHAFLIEMINDYDVVIEELNRFLPFVDNWATCDMMSPKIFKKHKNELLVEIDRWIKSRDTYTVRYGIKCLMQHYLDEDFKEEYLEKVINIESEQYYVNMMRAWYFATALYKQFKTSIKVLEERKLDKWTHNKTISKALESYCVTQEDKAYIKSLRY